MKDEVILNFDLYKKYKSEYAPDSFHHVAFKTQNYDAMVDCFPSCKSESNPAKYEPISSGDHLRNKFVKQTTYDQ